jgi:K+-transporting ATPase ATPase C chain
MASRDGIIFLSSIVVAYLVHTYRLWRRVRNPASIDENANRLERASPFHRYGHWLIRHNHADGIHQKKETPMVRRNLRQAAVSFVLFTVITGLIYPLVVSGAAQILFPWKANGSLLTKEGKVVGSVLIGQPFSDPKYFWGRLSATSPAYNAGASSGSNYGPLNPALFDAAKQRIKDLRGSDSLDTNPIPVDLVTASGSGLDPDITAAGALYQVHRVAEARHVSEDKVRALINRYTEGRQLGVLGEPRVNVLELNLALDDSINLAEVN